MTSTHLLFDPQPKAQAFFQTNVGAKRRRLRLRVKRGVPRSGLTLFELLLALVIGLSLMGLLIKSVIKARQRALVAALTESGARTTLNPDGTVRMLDVSRMSIVSIGDNLERMARLRNLYAINLDHTAVTRDQLEPILADMDLVQLHLVGTDITDAAVDTIVGQSRLDFLDVRATFLSDDGISRLAKGLPRLRNLRISETWITDDGLRKLTALKDLEILDLRGTDISDASVDTLSQFPALRTVRLNATRVTPEAARSLKRLRPELRIEYRDDSNMYHEWVGVRFTRHVNSRQQRELLNAPDNADTREALTRTRIYRVELDNSSSPLAIQRLPQLRLLQSLTMRGDWLSDDDLGQLWMCHRLSSLDLSDTPVTDDCFEALGRCRMLHSLGLNGTNITGEKLSELRKCRGLSMLKLYGVTLSDKGWSELATLSEQPRLKTITLPIFRRELTERAEVILKIARNVDYLELRNGHYSGRELKRLIRSLQDETSESSSTE